MLPNSKPASDSAPQICTHCQAICTSEQLYCTECGCILPIALLGSVEERNMTTHLGGLQSQPADLQWGTGYFHRNAHLFLRINTSDELIRVPIDKPPVIIGRQSGTATPNIDLTPWDGEGLGVSRYHVRIDRLRDALQVTDLNSANGTFLNSTRIEPGVPHVLRNRAVLQLGRLVLRIHFM